MAYFEIVRELSRFARPSTYGKSGTVTISRARDAIDDLSDDGGNNIDHQPHLDGDLRLSSDSPCRDAGDNASVANDDFDVDDDTVTTGEDAPDRDLLTRIVDDVVDMGCYEYCPLCP